MAEHVDARINIWTSSGFKTYYPYIYVDNQWVKVTPYVYSSSAWKSVGIPIPEYLAFYTSTGDQFYTSNGEPFMVKNN